MDVQSPMWKSKKPPTYVWKDDIWYNELDNQTYVADIYKQVWRLRTNPHEINSRQFSDIPFPPKTQVRSK